MRNLAIFGLLIALAGTVCAQAPIVPVTANITVSQTWTSANVYDLQDQIFVLPGATLTIEAGTIVIADQANDGGLVVTNGAQINVLGDERAPVIMTSTADFATWTNQDPSTSSWRESANEWGNLTVMGDGYIGGLGPGNANTATPDAGNVEQMEGLTVQAGLPASTTQYGGGDDDYDAGTIRYLSIRYGGRVLALTNELNGLSLGGLGRDTDMHHIEIMNNVDDGIEIWGGTLNLKYFSVWNIGDDSLDCDQGWRGKAQFGLIVQGWSLDTGSGGGVGDNAIEMDGAEDPDYQPVTSSAVANITIVGQPGAPGASGGDDAIALRDNANLQLRNMLIMDVGDDTYDGNGNENGGYAFGASYDEATRTTTLASADPNGTNAPANLAAFYQAQDPTGTLLEVRNTVVFNGEGNDGNGLNEWNSFWNAPALNNVASSASLPIVSITRDTPVVRGGRVMAQVLSIDPRPTGDALGVGVAFPNDSFFAPATYAGAFAENENWLCGWTASETYGFTPGAAAGEGGQSSNAIATLDANDAHNNQCASVFDHTAAGPFRSTTYNENLEITFSGEANRPVILWTAPLSIGVANFGPAIGQVDVGNFVPAFPFFTAEVLLDGSAPTSTLDFFATTGSTGTTTLSFPTDAIVPGTELWFQAAISGSGSQGIILTNAVGVLFN